MSITSVWSGTVPRNSKRRPFVRGTRLRNKGSGHEVIVRRTVKEKCMMCEGMGVKWMVYVRHVPRGTRTKHTLSVLHEMGYEVVPTHEEER